MSLDSSTDQRIDLEESDTWQVKDRIPKSATPKASDLPPQILSLDHTKILVVDGDPDTCHLFTLVLEETGAEVTIAKSCNEALIHIQNETPDILISEIALPDESGFTLVHKAREWMSLMGHHLLAMAVTIYAQDEDRAAICSGGFQGYLAKPVDIYELVDAIADMVRQKKE
jgi:two-component system, OmpR family, response regulator